MSEPPLLTIGKRLRLARLEARVTQRQAAKHVDRTRQSVAGWEAGLVEIGVLQLALLADLYGVTADYLLYGKVAVPGSLEEAEDAQALMRAAFEKAGRP